MLNENDRAELERLRLSAAQIFMNPLDRAFFNLQRIIDQYPKDSAFYVLANAIEELKRAYET